MMQLLAAILLLTAGYPLRVAWARNRATTLWHPLLWTGLAWLAWLVVTGGWAFWPGWDRALTQYLALSLTGCAGVAVLGARRPTAGAWHFVVVGLLAVLLLPVAEGFGTPRLNAVYLTFLAATLAVAFLNYLPTPLAPAVLCLAAACGIEIAGLANAHLPDGVPAAGRCLVGLTPWAALAALRGRARARTDFDRTWLLFRDRFGVVWGQRTREQFNRAATNAALPMTLTWQGLQPSAEGVPVDHAAALEILRALLKRFEWGCS